MNTVLVEAEPFLTSKQTWANFVTAVCGYFAARNIPVDPATQAALVTILVAGANMVFSVLFKKPVTLSGASAPMSGIQVTTAAAPVPPAK